MMKEKIERLEEQFAECVKRLHSSKLYDFNLGGCELDNTALEFEEYWAYDSLCRMYNIVCAYLELLGLPDYLARFRQKYEAVIRDREKALEFGAVPLRDGDIYDDFLLLIEWETFVAPLGLFRTTATVRRRNLERLIRLLESTNEILKTTRTRVTNEENINAVIRKMARFYYSGVTAYSEGYFVHPFKEYRPDVIIREIGASIEYKLIRGDNEIGPKIDELLVDAQRYTGNPKNELCIAVFCLSQSVTRTKKEVEEDWNGRRFPDCWRLVVVSDVHIEGK